MDPQHHILAEQLWQAASSRQPCKPLRERAAELNVPLTVKHAYAVQRINRDRRIRLGDRVVGRKIGLTSKSVQQQLGVDQPDYGSLWSGTAWGDGEQVAVSTLIQPKVEAEVAFIIGRDIEAPDATLADVLRATEYLVAAIEVVDSRIAEWRIGLFDTVADNASAAGFVLGGDPVRPSRCSLREAHMTMTRNGQGASEGAGRACLGHPANAAVWLARALARMGDPLRAGDVVLTGALGPMVTVIAGDEFEARIDGLGAVSVRFGA